MNHDTKQEAGGIDRDVTFAAFDMARQSGWRGSDNQDGDPASQPWHDRRGVMRAQ
jgi:hypothetical protein